MDILEAAKDFLPTTVLLGVIWYWVKDFKDRLEGGVEKFYSNISQDLRVTQKALMEHRDSMGKCTKAINGDMLTIKQDFISFKTELFEQHQSLKSKFSDLQKEGEALTHRLQMSIEKYQSRSKQMAEAITLMEGYDKQVKLVKEMQKKLIEMENTDV